MVTTTFSGILLLIKEFLTRWTTNDLFALFLYFIIINFIIWALRKFVFLP